MSEFDIYVGGYSITGAVDQPACYVGKSTGTDFHDACKNYYRVREDVNYYDPIANTFWACGLYPTMEEAER